MPAPVSAMPEEVAQMLASLEGASRRGADTP